MDMDMFFDVGSPRAQENTYLAATSLKRAEFLPMSYQHLGGLPSPTFILETSEGETDPFNREIYQLQEVLPLCLS